MPDMAGLELHHAIAGTERSLPVVFITGHSDEDGLGLDGIGDPGGIRTRDLHLERVACWASAPQGRERRDPVV